MLFIASLSVWVGARVCTRMSYSLSFSLSLYFSIYPRSQCPREAQTLSPYFPDSLVQDPRGLAPFLRIRADFRDSVLRACPMLDDKVEFL